MKYELSPESKSKTAERVREKLDPIETETLQFFFLKPMTLPVSKKLKISSYDLSNRMCLILLPFTAEYYTTSLVFEVLYFAIFCFLWEFRTVALFIVCLLFKQDSTRALSFYLFFLGTESERKSSHTSCKVL